MDSDARSSSMEACDREEKGTRKITISDQINSLQYANVKSDSFIVDMERFSHVTSKDVTPNSRITVSFSSFPDYALFLDLEPAKRRKKKSSDIFFIPGMKKLQRSFSRKGSQRAAEKKMSASGDSERETSSVVATSSPRGVIKGGDDSISITKALQGLMLLEEDRFQIAAFVGVGTPEKPMLVTVGPTDHPANPQVQHQITIVTGNVGTTTPTGESRYGNRRFSFRRSSSSWTIDPRRILLIFATLSSMGTILLIYFTLSMGKLGEDDNALN
ncbi:hypothetical protein RJ640_005528 [Escallonia rubra]|uniref:Uncharacterized protein n=1 Tax=Escallonia rubra TaxID=112253 RepID=A0AA88UCS5_9ASTE|nr:hypothetical protein RJ640_005528 [Escallonia rubra]